MRQLTTAAVAAIVATAGSAQAATFWTGYDFEFVKTGFAGTGPDQQDRITNDVWLTRSDVAGILNIASEEFYSFDVSPEGTLWAFGTIDDGVGTLSFSVWRDWHGGNPPSSVGRNAVLYIPADDLYIDIRFTSWGGAASGGAFSYVRGIPAPASAGLLGLAGLVAARRRR
ncbi:MAG: VPLPA-CTERM sorting domain-containing protein [Planctomycetota bacterium]